MVSFGMRVLSLSMALLVLTVGTVTALAPTVSAHHGCPGEWDVHDDDLVGFVLGVVQGPLLPHTTECVQECVEDFKDHPHPETYQECQRK